MGGKDQTQASLPTSNSSNDYSMEMMAMMSQMMEGMSASMEDAYANMPTTPDIADAPRVETTPSVDWGAKMDELRAKTTAEYSMAQKAKKGRMDTVHTSPLLDEEEDDIAPSIIGSTG